MPSKSHVLLALLLIAAVPGAAAEFERFLLPIYLTSPAIGAFGSVWITEAIVTNSDTEPVEIDDVGTTCRFGCVNEPIPAGVSIPLVFQGLEITAVPGRFLDVQRGRDVAVQLRVRDLSASHLNWGTELPVISESRGSARVDITGIPLAARYRQLLRVYDFSQTETRVRVRVFDVDPTPGITWPGNAPDPVLADFAVPMTRGASDQPSYAQIGDLDIRAAASRHGFIRVEVPRLDDVAALWAFVSLTNNETQQVTTITPQ